MKTLSLFLPILHIFLLNALTKNMAMALENHTDHLSLLKFKESITNDPNGILASWNTSTHFCKWHGITCNPMHQRVTKLNLQGNNLHGSISPHLGNLSRIRNLDLGNNTFYGKIPQEFGNLLQLRYLILINNSLVGEFPINLTKCSKLKSLDLAGNKLHGNIPTQIGSLQNLENLFIEKNNFSGKIPFSIHNLSHLSFLSIGYNNFEGNIPKEICYLKKLKFLTLPINNFFGTFPSCFYNMSSLTMISAAKNQFNGTLPPNFFNSLPNLQYFAIADNHLSGSIPISISNASNLELIDMAENFFTGQVPSLGKLEKIWALSFSANSLGDNSTKDLEFFDSLKNCSNLELFSIAYNNFGGHLPNSVGNFSAKLRELYLGGNKIIGKIPAELGNIVSLTLLTMEVNHIEGIIPKSFERFKNIQVLDLSQNKISGDVPTFIGSLSQLFFLHLGQNSLEGNVPSSIGSCKELQYLNLSQNNLKGSIPFEVFSLSSLTNLLDLSQNSLSGSLPKEVGMLKNLNELDVSENRLSGDIPGTIAGCISLEYLKLQGNSFHGVIPSSLASLKGLRYLDLSRNQFSGSIPDVLQNISVLEHLNVSFNMLDGEVPTKGVFGNVSGLALSGNKKFCGGISRLHLPPCLVKDRKSSVHHSSKLIVVIVCVAAFFIILSSILAICWIIRTKKKNSFHSAKTGEPVNVSYRKLHSGTDGFSDENLIGSGSFGSVYKGFLESEDKAVAVKVLNLQKKGAHKSFIAECNALKNIRHRNLVKILTCCSSSDYKGQAFKALVFHYMENGSLEQWLHLNEDHPRKLDLAQRLNIITDIASALHYLHHECEQPVLHCDLKPNNVLLDDDMVAHVSDFGIARLVSTIDGTSHKQTSTIGIKGTIGYAPPEYGVGSEVSTSGDVYSFGILVLEMLTGRRPTDDMFEDGQTLHNFVENSFSDNILQILDPQLVPRDEEEEELVGEKNEKLISNAEKCLVSLFRIGLHCSLESPRERMSMVDVAREVNQIRKVFLGGEMTRNL